MKRVYRIVLVFVICGWMGRVHARPAQPLEALTVTDKRLATVEVLTDQGEFEYPLDPKQTAPFDSYKP